MTKQEKAKDKRLQKIYKRSLAEFNAMLEEQGNKCDICGKPFPEYVAFQDHFHKCCPRSLEEYCGKCNRGGLCFQCNKFCVGIMERQNIPIEGLYKYMKKWEHLNVLEKPKSEKRKKK